MKALITAPFHESGFKILNLQGVKYFSNKYYDNFFAIVKK